MCMHVVYTLFTPHPPTPTNVGQIKSVSVAVAGRNAFMRVACFSGDAMGMNMISKGCLKVTSGD